MTYMLPSPSDELDRMIRMLAAVNRHQLRLYNWTNLGQLHRYKDKYITSGIRENVFIPGLYMRTVVLLVEE